MNKEEAKQLIDGLPEGASWEDLMYQIYVRQRVETALQEIEQGKIVPHEEVKQRFLS
jgi:predicted transcriptional regulator